MSEALKSNVISLPRKYVGQAINDANPVIADRMPVTSTKTIKNNGLYEACHRPNIPVPVTVTVIEKENPRKRGTVSAYEASVTDDQWRKDIATMTKGKLQAAYPGTSISFKDMKYVRAKPVAKGGEGATIDPSVETLAGFMIALRGPRRHPDMTVDRIDPNDPTYASGKIMWKDKKGQANNRSTNSHVRNPRTKEWGTVAEVAAQVGLKANTITVALKRAIEKAPEQEEAIRASIVGDILLRKGQDIGGVDEDAPTGEIVPMPGYGMAADPEFRCPWPLTKVQRQWIEDVYQCEKPMEVLEERVETAHGSYIARPRRPVSRFDFAISLCVRMRVDAKRLIADIEYHEREHYLDQREEADLADARETVDRMNNRIAAADRARPAFLEELAEHRRAHGRTLAPWEVEEQAHIARLRAQREREEWRSARNKPYVDEEDRAMKDAELFGPDDFDDEHFSEEDEYGEHRYKLEHERTEAVLRDRLARRRGIDL